MQHYISLDDIRREASALEFDVSTSAGYLRIVKRSDSTLCYLSTQPLGDAHTLTEAWTWLQRCRATIDQLDLARAGIVYGHPAARQGRTLSTALRFGTHDLPALVGGGIVHILTDNLYISGGAFALLTAATWWLRHRRSTRKGNI